MNWSFQEKSHGVIIAGMLVVYGGYFATVLPTATEQLQPMHIVWFILAVVVLTITQIVGQTVIALTDRRQQIDERGRLFALLGARNGSYVLSTGVFCALTTLACGWGSFVFAHLLLAFWVMAQLMESATVLLLARRGATA
ncbi:MAG: hypothetical protein ACRCZF_25250 [Gemmataceae bacterium]